MISFTNLSRLILGQIQGVAEPGPQLIVIENQQLVCVLQKVLAAFILEAIDRPRRSSRKEVDEFLLPLAFHDLQFGESLRRRQEKRVEVAAIGSIKRGPFQSSEKAAHLRCQNASDPEAVLAQSTSQLHCVGVGSISGLQKGSGIVRTALRQLRRKKRRAEHQHQSNSKK